MPVSPADTASPVLSNARKRILVIDDEPEVGRIATRILERLGHQVSATTNSQAGIELLRDSDEPFDWVLLDWTMPGISGVSMLQALRAIRPSLPIVVMSGYTTQMLSEQVDLGQLNAFIQKPFRIDELRRVAQQMV